MFLYKKTGAFINHIRVALYSMYHLKYVCIYCIYIYKEVKLRVIPKAYLSACGRSNDPRPNHWLMFVDALVISHYH